VVFRGHTGAVSAVAFDANGSGVLSGGHDKTVRRWDPDTGKQVGDTWKPAREPDRFVFSPDGRRVLVHTLTTELYDTTTQKTLLAYPDSGNPHLGGSAFSPDGKRVVMGKATIGGDVFAAVWDLDSNKRLRSPGHAEREYITVVALSADGKLGVSATKGGVHVWEVGADKDRRFWKGLPVTALAFTADDKLILTGNALGSLVLRDPANEEEVGRFEGHTARITALALSADGESLLSGSDDGTARLWSVKTRKELRKLDGHTGPVLSVAISADGRRALTGGKDGTVRLWDLRGAAP
jgi:WD40 repeat protein